MARFAVLPLLVLASLAAHGAPGVPAAAAAPLPRERVVVAYENRSGNPKAPDLLADGLDSVVARYGYDVVDGRDVADYAAATKLVADGPFSAREAGQLTLRFRADVALVVVINFVLEGEPRAKGPRANPAVGLTAKMLAPDGRVVWRGALAILGDEVKLSEARNGAKGAIRAVVATACERLFFSLPRAKASLYAGEREPAPGFTAARRPAGRPRFPLALPPSNRMREAIKAGAASPKKR